MAPTRLPMKPFRVARRPKSAASKRGQVLRPGDDISFDDSVSTLGSIGVGNGAYFDHDIESSSDVTLNEAATVDDSIEATGDGDVEEGW